MSHSCFSTSDRVALGWKTQTAFLMLLPAAASNLRTSLRSFWRLPSRQTAVPIFFFSFDFSFSLTCSPANS
jgi:hypothetical protein